MVTFHFQETTMVMDKSDLLFGDHQTDTGTLKEKAGITGVTQPVTSLFNAV